MAEDYTRLITSQHKERPRFMDTVALLTGELGKITDAVLELPRDFDVEHAIGKQLDSVGLWVGIGRSLNVPLDVYFSFDIPGRGFDQGIWKFRFDPDTGVTVMDDNTYRLVIKSTIAADNWDGTLTSYQTILQEALQGTGNTFRAIDHQDMSFTVEIDGPPLSGIISGVLNSGQLLIKPAGVAIADIITP